MNKAIVCAILAAAAGSAFAGSVSQMVIRGSFNGWSDAGQVVMTEVNPDVWYGVISGLGANGNVEFKATTEDWSYNGPSSNIQTRANAAGDLEVYAYTQDFADGWLPGAGPRVGYVNNVANWEVMGSFNGWSTAVASFTDVGGGIMRAVVDNLTAGSYEFKARGMDDWSVTVGDGFGSTGANMFATVADGEDIEILLDLEGGRYQINLIPTPAGLAVLGLGGLVGTRRRR
ncbi:MAG: hypothetical protein H6810_05735 [Phycisphaeraceae bacterium]|nr:MAG: hypothetical protein H6810_05735 [Phycisphaeraceae bacterium]